MGVGVGKIGMRIGTPCPFDDAHGLADLLARFALFDDNPARINTLVSEFEKVTPQLIQKTAQDYLGPENRTVLVVETKPAEAPAAPAKN